MYKHTKYYFLKNQGGKVWHGMWLPSIRKNATSIVVTLLERKQSSFGSGHLFLYLLDMYIYICVCVCVCVCVFGEIAIQILCPFESWTIFLLSNFKISLFYMQLPYQMHDLQILMLSNLSIFLLSCVLLVLYFKTHCLLQGHEDFL